MRDKELWEEQSQRKRTAGSKEEDGGCQAALTNHCSNKN